MHDADALIEDGDNLLQGRRRYLGPWVAGSWTGSITPRKTCINPTTHTYPRTLNIGVVVLALKGGGCGPHGYGDPAFDLSD